MSDKKIEYTGDSDMDELMTKVIRIMKTKAVDYAKEGDRLAQFRSASEKYGVSMRQVLGVYMDKHMESINKWICGEELRGEPIEDKLLDNVVYSLLGYKIAKEERRSVGPTLRKLPVKEIDTVSAAPQKHSKDKTTNEDTRVLFKQTCLLKCDTCEAVISLSYPKSSRLSVDEWRKDLCTAELDCAGCIDVRMIDTVKSAESKAMSDQETQNR